MGAVACHALLWSLLWSPRASCGKERAAPRRAPCRALRCAACFSPPPGLFPSPSPCACAQAGPLPALAGRAHRWRGLGPTGGQVCPPSAAGGCASPPAAASLLIAVTVSVQRGNLGTESDPAAPHPLHWCYCGWVWPRSSRGRFLGRWRSLRTCGCPSVRPRDGNRPPQPSQLREATVTRARPSTPLLQAQPALLPVLFLKEFLVLFQCRGLCTVLSPRFPSLFYCTIMAVAGSWCNMEVL